MIEVAMFFGGLVAGMLCTAICCFITREESDDDMPIAVATQAEVDSSAVTVYEFENVDEDL